VDFDVDLFRRIRMRMHRTVGALAIGLLVAFGAAGLLSGQTSTGVITGVVTSAQGAEEGVWVIAETTDLQTTFRKTVVTGEGGRFLLPELPYASYDVWVRGFGLVDSERVVATPGQDLELTAATGTPQEVAEFYPSPSWVSMMDLPAADEFPGTGDNGLNPDLESVEEYIFRLNNCSRCHKLGSKFLREVPPHDMEGNPYESSADAWNQRVRMGQRAAGMNNNLTQLGRERAMEMLADWTDRVAAGEVPEQPERPQGVERNLVLTQWEWGTGMTKIHDLIATDKRDPSVNPYGEVYGTDIARDQLTILDPVANTARELLIPTLEDRGSMPTNYAQSGYIARLGVMDRFNPTNIHNPMMDQDGRVWYTAFLRRRDNQPDWCLEGADNRFAQYFPLERAGRNVSYYDPSTTEFTMVDTCFGTHHLQFGFDDDNTLYFSGHRGLLSWINTAEHDSSGNDETSQGWCPMVVDTNGDGQVTKPWNEPGEENPDLTLDSRVMVGMYGLIQSPTTNAIWGAEESHPGRIIRIDRGDNPPESCIAEVYDVPSEIWGSVGALSEGPSVERGSRPRGLDVDTKGIIWTALAASNHLASFDRNKCQSETTPATRHAGEICAEGWTLYPLPSPRFRGTQYGTDFYYYNYVDQFDTLGLGIDVPIATGTGSDSLIALLPDTGEAVMLRVPYPLNGFHPRGMDGRIDDPDAGWKGRGIYSSTASDTVWHDEDGVVYENGEWSGVSRPNVVKFQIRPHPLAN
jgi:hypothetical protein